MTMDETTGNSEDSTEAVPEPAGGRRRLVRRVAGPLLFAVAAAGVGGAVATYRGAPERVAAHSVRFEQHGAMGERMAHGMVRAADHRSDRMADRRAERMAALAEQLGVSEDALAAARETVREELHAEGTSRPSEVDRDAHRAALLERLATELGVDPEELTAAMLEHRSMQGDELRMGRHGRDGSRSGMAPRSGMAGRHGSST
jgi:hypothetical protein